MKVTLDIPDWAIGRHIYIFAGTELLAHQLFNDKKERVNEEVVRTQFYSPLKVKPSDGRCKGCSTCCESGQSQDILDLMLKTLGNYLMKQGEFSSNEPCPFHSYSGCILGAWIPLSCAKSVCTAFDGCTERFD